MKISILGCGWLGTPLAESLLEQGHSVKGSTTTPDKLGTLREKGIDPYLIELDPELYCDSCEAFWDADLLILNIPPGRGKEDVVEYHTSQIRSVIPPLENSPIDHLIFISSTSVYPDRSGIMDESDAVAGKAGRPSGEALLTTESLLMQSNAFETTVLRFGGLYGHGRHPVHHLAGREGLDNAKAPVNLIHRDDCIAIIEEVIDRQIGGEVFNAVSDGHPPRSQFYKAAAEEFGLEPPKFRERNGTDGKVVSNNKLKRVLGYRFKYPNPMNFQAP
ncbi:MAG: SDR family oxidoreductase [Balneolaceae bacterium]|nr:SDR family oxidoreductase [Balneolaceae bacterium]